MPAVTKRYYSVKEAAKLLSVSTNTIYTYLKDGQLRARRIGKGRIKILANSLLPYVDNQKPDNSSIGLADQNREVEKPQYLAFNETEQSNTDTLNLQIASGSVTSVGVPQVTKEVEDRPIAYDAFTIAPSNNDVFFFRIFKGVSFLGLGIIYLLTSQNIFKFSGVFSEEISQILTVLLPYSLMGAGIVNLLEVLYPRVFSRFHLGVDLLTTLMLSYFFFIALNSGTYGRLIFIAAFAVVAISHLIQSAHKETSHTFFEIYSKFALSVSIIAGVIIIMFPTLIPLGIIGSFIGSHSGVFAFIWFLVLVLPLLYYSSSLNKNVSSASFYFVIRAVLAFVLGTQLLLTSNWDLAYLAYLMGIFDLFLAWWSSYGTPINTERAYFLVIVFVWISATLVFGNMALRSSQSNLISKETDELSQKLQNITSQINSFVDKQQGILTTYAGSPQLVEVLETKDQEKAISLAKEIYEKSENARRVNILTSDGIAIGVYPRDSLNQGANLSSRVYFQETKSSYKGYFSNVYPDLGGDPSLMHTEPIFKENKFSGMIGIGIDLSILYTKYKNLIPQETEIYALDKEGKIVFAKEAGDIGQPLLKTSYGLINKNEEIILNNISSASTGWHIFSYTPTYPLLNRLSDTNIYLSLILIINSLVSIAIGILVAGNKKISISDSLADSSSQISKPQFN